ncbi:MAG: aspartate carbamoyltransferase catalytic subunit [Gammaproteobacteria bacterium]|tara:strand:- start:5096 stop:6004 length:909 start_codon:yes stop_codon:yes gene_type:complete
MNKNLLSLADLSRKEIEDLISFAEKFINEDGSFKKESLFPDKTIANIFCEPSTRTKSSFEIAAKNLGCNVLDFDTESSSLQKGESIYETIDALSLMGVDLCVLRHSESVIHELAQYIPEMTFINGGEGSISHPTQGLLDLMTIIQHKKTPDDQNIVIVGDLDHSRVTASFLEGLNNFKVKSLTFSGHPDMCKSFQNHPQGKYEPDLDLAIEGSDVVMALRIQHERLAAEDIVDIDQYKYEYQINSERLAMANEEAILMHPGPVNLDIEISTMVYESDQSVIRQQIANGVAIRMAVLSQFLSG